MGMQPLSDISRMDRALRRVDEGGVRGRESQGSVRAKSVSAVLGMSRRRVMIIEAGRFLGVDDSVAGGGGGGWLYQVVESAHSRPKLGGD